MLREEKILSRRGNSPRQYPNTLVFLAADRAVWMNCCRPRAISWIDQFSFSLGLIPRSLLRLY
jgi:hypothetical protein